MIVLADDRLLVAHKPAGLLSVSGAGEGRSLEDALAEQGVSARAVHRLDRDVSGCVLCARDEEARGALEKMFRERTLLKTYWALAQGRVEPERGEWKDPILEERGFARVSARGKPSRTRYRTLERHRRVTELEIDLITGRYNQIRVHAAHAGNPLVGERKYAEGKRDPLRGARLALHALQLEFVQPFTGERVVARAPLPLELERLREAAAAD